MPMTRARRLCPDAVVVSPGFETFEVVSRSVMETFRQVTPLVEVLSLDEAFLDVSGAVRRLGSPYAIAELLRARIYDEQGITCSVGMAATVAVAKLASRRAKPDGIVVVPPSAVTTFLHPLDVGELWGVGEKTAELLHRLGLMTVGDVAHTPLSHAAARGRRAPGQPAAPAGLGGGPPGGDRPPWRADEPDKSMGARRDLRPRHRRPRRWCCARCCGSRPRWPAGCGPPGWPAGR